MELDFVAEHLLRTRTPDGRTVRLPPPVARTPHLEQLKGELPFAPAYGQHTEAVLAELGLGASEVAALKERGTVA
jgi:crotonobetainyl-CoA:carnitine CoA-transferase CaiB-like acyl-CoA transferase